MERFKWGWRAKKWGDLRGEGNQNYGWMIKVLVNCLLCELIKKQNNI